MERKPWLNPALPGIFLALVALACGTATPAVSPTPAPTVPAQALWMRLAGESKADQSWAVTSDAQGDLYWGTFQQTPGELFSDMVIYKFAPDGSLIWESRYGGDFQEKLFILALSPPYLLAGGEQDDSLDITQSDMVVLALDLQDGDLAWEFTYDQGYGYEEVDGLVAEDDAIYVSGWTTSAETGNDIGVLRLDPQGRLVWAQAWGSPGWDQADGQMVVDDEFIYITGRYDGDNFLTGGSGLLAVFRKDSGAYVRHVTFGEGRFADGYGMTSDGTYLYITGITLVPRQGLPADGQIFVQKWTRDLELLWERQWGGAGGDQARAVGMDDAGRVVVAGNTIVDGDHQIVLLVYEGEGDLLVETVWGGAGREAVHGLWIDGEYALLAGETHSAGAGANDAMLLRVHIPSGAFPPAP